MLHIALYIYCIGSDKYTHKRQRLISGWQQSICSDTRRNESEDSTDYDSTDYDSADDDSLNELHIQKMKNNQTAIYIQFECDAIRCIRIYANECGQILYIKHTQTGSLQYYRMSSTRHLNQFDYGTDNSDHRYFIEEPHLYAHGSHYNWFYHNKLNSIRRYSLGKAHGVQYGWHVATEELNYITKIADNYIYYTMEWHENLITRRIWPIGVHICTARFR